MIEPTDDHLRAILRVFGSRRVYLHVYDEITFSDDRDPSEIPDDEEWTPLQREGLADIARAVLNVGAGAQS